VVDRPGLRASPPARLDCCVMAWSSQKIFSALAQRFPPEAYALLAEVRNQTGYGRNVRTADAICMSLYPSRGLDLSGFEFKSSRRDWIRELETPDKAEAVATFCDFWWLVVGDPRIVENGEVPPTWGLLVPNGDKLKVAKQPERLKPQPVSRLFLASLMRRISEPPKGAAIEEAKNDAYRRGVEEGGRREVTKHGRELATLQQSHAALQHAVTTFESVSGVKITTYGGQRLGEMVNYVLHSRLDDHRKALRQVRLAAENVVRCLADVEM
jgi:hypothetical protein